MLIPAALLLLSPLLAADDPPPEVRGTIVDARGRPVPGAEILLSPDFAGTQDARPVLARATSGEGGHFRFARPSRDRFPVRVNAAIWAYKPGLGLAAVPYEFFGESNFYRVVLDPQPPQAVDVKGPDEAPMPDVRLTLELMTMQGPRSFKVTGPPDELAERLAVVTDAAGKAELPAMNPTLRNPSLRVSSATIAAQVPPRSPPALYSLVLRPAGRLAGSVEREDGRSAEGLVLRVEATVRGSINPNGRIAFLDGPVRVGPDGAFHPAGDLLEGMVYRVTALAPGLDSDRSEWTAPAGPGKTATLPPLRLRPLRSVSGVVRDRQGRPIPGAEVIQAGDGPEPTVTKADDAGRFTLRGFRAGPALITARAEGFRFGGRVVLDGENAIVLTRTTEIPERAMPLLPPPIPRAELRRIAREALAPELDAALKGKDHSAKFKAIQSLARIDPAESLRVLRSSGLKGRLMLPGRIAVEFANRGDLAGADAAIGESDTPEDRADAMLSVIDALPADRAAEKLDRLQRAREALGEMATASGKVSLYGQVAERLLELGRGAEARGLFASGLVPAEALPGGDENRAEFAAQLAAVDLPTALRLIEGIPVPKDRTRSVQNAAIRLAATRPADCERLLRDHGVVAVPLQVLHRMAAVDTARALRLAEIPEEPGVSATYRIVVAHGLARTNPAEAVRLCQSVISERSRRSIETPSANLVLLEALTVDLVEEIDPSLVAEYLWKTLSQRRGEIFGRPLGPEDTMPCRLAAIVARYDREIAAALLAPTAARVARSGPGEAGPYSGDLIQAFARVSPREVPALFAAISRTDNPRSLGWLRNQRVDLSDLMGTNAGPGRGRMLDGMGSISDGIKRRDVR